MFPLALVGAIAPQSVHSNTLGGRGDCKLLGSAKQRCFGRGGGGGGGGIIVPYAICPLATESAFVEHIRIKTFLIASQKKS